MCKTPSYVLIVASMQAIKRFISFLTVNLVLDLRAKKAFSLGKDENCV